MWGCEEPASGHCQSSPLAPACPSYQQHFGPDHGRPPGCQQDSTTPEQRREWGQAAAGLAGGPASVAARAAADWDNPRRLFSLHEVSIIAAAIIEATEEGGGQLLWARVAQIAADAAMQA